MLHEDLNCVFSHNKMTSIFLCEEMFELSIFQPMEDDGKVKILPCNLEIIKCLLNG